MKLIIDIDDEMVCKDIKSKALYPTSATDEVIINALYNGIPYEERPQSDLIKAFELLKAHCKNRECNKDCVFYRELRVGDNTEQFCGLCEIVTSDDKEAKKNLLQSLL